MKTKIDWRDWKPLPLKRLKEIVRDTVQDNPPQMWTPDEVYRLAAELLAHRSKKKE